MAQRVAPGAFPSLPRTHGTLFGACSRVRVRCESAYVSTGVEAGFHKSEKKGVRDMNMTEMMVGALRVLTWADLAAVVAWIAMECWDFFIERR